MSKQIKLGLDLDGLVLNFNAQFIKLANERYHRDIPAAGLYFPRTWDYIDEYLTKQESRDLWDFIVKESEDFWLTCPFYPYAAKLLVSAASVADHLYFISSRSGRRVQWQTHKVLTDKFPFLARAGVICTPSAEAKIDIINALDLTHYVDDKKETITEVYSRCFNTNVAVWRQPWNAMASWPPVVSELKNVGDFQQWLQ